MYKNMYVYESIRTSIYIYIDIYGYMNLYKPANKELRALWQVRSNNNSMSTCTRICTYTMYTNIYVHDSTFTSSYIYMCSCTYTNLQTKSRVPHDYPDATATVCQYVHEYVRTRCIRICTWTSLCVHIYTYMYMYVYKPAIKELRAPLLPRCNHNSMSICTRIRTYTMYMNMYVHESMCTSIHMYMYMYLYNPANKDLPHDYRDVTTTACQYVHEYVRTRVYKYIYIYTHVHVRIQTRKQRAAYPITTEM